MSKSSELSGWVYILEHSSYPGLVKIGYTSRTIEHRIRELESATGAIPGYKCFYRVLCMNPEKLEKSVHKFLASSREWRNKEFFRVEHNEAVNALNIQIHLKNIEIMKVVDQYKINEGIKAKAELDKIESDRIYQKKLKRLELEKEARDAERKRKEKTFERLPPLTKLQNLSASLIQETDQKLRNYPKKPTPDFLWVYLGFIAGGIFAVWDTPVNGPLDYLLAAAIGGGIGWWYDMKKFRENHLYDWEMKKFNIESSHNKRVKELANRAGVETVPKEFLR